MKKTLALFFVVSPLLFNPLLSLKNVSAAADYVFKYKDANTISGTVQVDKLDNADFQLTYKDPHGAGSRNAGNVFGSNLRTYVVSLHDEKNNYDALAVDRTDPTKGDLYRSDEEWNAYTTNGYGWDKVQGGITIGGDTSVIPKAGSFIKDGAIKGRLIPIGANGTENGWKTPVDSVLHGAQGIISESFLGEGIWVYIKDEGDNVIIQKHLQKESYGWRYDDMPLSEMQGGGLWTDTTYYLKIDLTDSLSNCTGNANNGNGQCTYEWKGSVGFTVGKDGTIHMLNPHPYANNTENNADGKKTTDLTRENGMNLDVVEYFKSPMTEALGQAIKWLSNSITSWTDKLASWIGVALDEANLDDTHDAWVQVRNISVSLLTLGIIIIVFANVLSLDIEQYGLQRMLPKFIINVILVFFSFLIMTVLLEAAKVLQTQFRALMSSGSSLAIPFHVDLNNLSGSDIVGQLGSVLFLIIMLVAVVIALLYLFLVLLARIVLIKFLLIAAPIALILGIMPFTESLLKRWWSEVFQWIFMGPAVMGVLLVGTIILKNAPAAGAVDLNAVNSNSLVAFRQIFYLGTAAITYFLAATIPTMMGGKIMAEVSKRTQGFMKWGAGTPLGAANWSLGKASSLAGRSERLKRVSEGLKKAQGFVPKGSKGVVSMWQQNKKDKEGDLAVDSGQTLYNWTKGKRGIDSDLAYAKAVKEYETLMGVKDDKYVRDAAMNPKLKKHIREAAFNERSKRKQLGASEISEAFNTLGEAAGIRIAMDTRKSHPEYFDQAFFNNIKDAAMRASVQGKPLFNQEGIVSKLETKEKLDLDPDFFSAPNSRNARGRLHIDKEFSEKMKTTQFESMMNLANPQSRQAVQNVRNQLTSQAINEAQAIAALQQVGSFSDFSDESQLNLVRHRLKGA